MDPTVAWCIIIDFGCWELTFNLLMRWCLSIKVLLIYQVWLSKFEKLILTCYSALLAINLPFFWFWTFISVILLFKTLNQYFVSELTSIHFSVGILRWIISIDNRLIFPLLMLIKNALRLIIKYSSNCLLDGGSFAPNKFDIFLDSSYLSILLHNLFLWYGWWNLHCAFKRIYLIKCPSCIISSVWTAI